MHNLLDRATILGGLAEEIRPLLPTLGGALSDLCSGLNPALAAEQALDTAFTVRAAAEMLDLVDLAEAAALVERAVPALSGGPLDLRREGRPAVRLLVASLEKTVEGLVDGLTATPPELAAGRVAVEQLVERRAQLEAASRRPMLDLDAMLATLPMDAPIQDPTSPAGEADEDDAPLLLQDHTVETTDALDRQVQPDEVAASVQPAEPYQNGVHRNGTDHSHASVAPDAPESPVLFSPPDSQGDDETIASEPVQAADEPIETEPITPPVADLEPAPHQVRYFDESPVEPVREDTRPEPQPTPKIEAFPATSTPGAAPRGPMAPIYRLIRALRGAPSPPRSEALAPLTLAPPPSAAHLPAQAEQLPSPERSDTLAAPLAPTSAVDPATTGAAHRKTSLESAAQIAESLSAPPSVAESAPIPEPAEPLAPPTASSQTPPAASAPTIPPVVELETLAAPSPATDELPVAELEAPESPHEETGRSTLAAELESITDRVARFQFVLPNPLAENAPYEEPDDLLDLFHSDEHRHDERTTSTDAYSAHDAEPASATAPETVAETGPIAEDEPGSVPETSFHFQPTPDVQPAPSVEPAQASEAVPVAQAAGPEPFVDPEILEVFQLESEELLGGIRDSVMLIGADLSNAAAAAEARRLAHTLKGAANIVGFSTIGALCACVEDLLDALHEAGQTVDQPVASFLVTAVETLEALSATPFDSRLADSAASVGAQGRTLAERVAPLDERSEEEEESVLAQAGEAAAAEAWLADLFATPAEETTELPAAAADSVAEATGAELAAEESEEIIPAEVEYEADADPAEIEAWNEAVRAFLADAAAAEAAEPVETTDIAAESPIVVQALSEPAIAPAAPFADGASLQEPARELLEVFAAEAEEHLTRLSEAALTLGRAPDDSAALAEARRVLHTLKGAAGSLGLDEIAALCHDSETRLGDETDAAPANAARVLIETTESIEALLAPESAEHPVEPEAAEAPAVQVTDAPAGTHVEPAEPVAPAAAIEPPALLADDSPATGVRIDLARVDELLNLVGNLAMNRASLEQRLTRLVRSADELRLTVARLRRVSQYLEDRYEVAELLRAKPDEPRLDDFDELEMDRYTELHRISREVAEISADTATTGDELEAAVKDVESLLGRQRGLGGELQDRMLAIRMVPLGSLQTRLERTALGVALRQEKRVRFTLEGSQIELDKVVLEQLGDVLIHLVRNAVDHGLESSEARRLAGKPAEGQVALRATREGGEVVVRVSDDGSGIDVDRLRDKAVRAGVITSDAALSRDELLNLVFVQGLSTSDETTEISGRGVGMDVVQAVIRRLKGLVTVESRPGQGTTFVLRLPVMMAVLPVMFVRAGGQPYALPMVAVERVLKPEDEGEQSVEELSTIQVDEELLQLADLGQALGLHPAPRAAGPRPVVVLHAGDQRVAVAVDQLLGQQEVVVKQLGPHLRSVRGVLGATIQANGQIALVLNTADLLVGRPAPSRAGRVSVAAPASEGPRRALVVDDSLSVRKVLARILEREGWEVRQARDGVEALEVMQGYHPDAVLLDVEMPRMDGFELAGILRDVPDYGQPPVVMITSRAGEKHRKRGDELGVAGYLVKPYQERDLLDTLEVVARRQAS
jgi:chemosensory pili system protein ChpA (sensor histidine kinase/response regulator)